MLVVCDSCDKCRVVVVVNVGYPTSPTFQTKRSTFFANGSYLLMIPVPLYLLLKRARLDSAGARSVMEYLYYSSLLSLFVFREIYTEYSVYSLE